MRLVDADELIALWSGISTEATVKPDSVIDTIKKAPTVPTFGQWIPVPWHESTDQEREKYNLPNSMVYMLDCLLPDDDQEILITTNSGDVMQDINYIDDGYYLDSDYDWINVLAWMPLPEPYKAESEG